MITETPFFVHPSGAQFTPIQQVASLRTGTCYAHDDAVIDDYVQAMDPVMAELADALSAGDIETRLAGGVVQPGFRRLN